MEPFFSDNKEKEEENQFIHAMELIGGSVLPIVLKALIELQVLDIIAEAGPGAQLSPSEILSRLPPSATLGRNPNAPEMLDRMLCFLVSHSILTCSVVSSNQAFLPASLVRPTRLYGLAPVAKYLVNNQDGCSLAPLLLFSQDKVFMDGWNGLKGAVLEGGIPFARVHGMQLFEYPGKDPRFNEVFNKAMLNVTIIIVKRILNSYKGFEQLQNLVDVAGGLGVTLHLITSKYPHIKAINFDLPHVIKHAPPYPDAAPLVELSDHDEEDEEDDESEEEAQKAEKAPPQKTKRRLIKAADSKRLRKKKKQHQEHSDETGDKTISGPVPKAPKTLAGLKSTEAAYSEIGVSSKESVPTSVPAEDATVAPAGNLSQSSAFPAFSKDSSLASPTRSTAVSSKAKIEPLELLNRLKDKLKKGTSSSQMSSSATSTESIQKGPSPEEVSKARDDLKAALSFNFETMIQPEILTKLKGAMDILTSSEGIPNVPQDQLRQFKAALPLLIQDYHKNMTEIQEMKNKQTRFADLGQALIIAMEKMEAFQHQKAQLTLQKDNGLKKIKEIQDHIILMQQQVVQLQTEDASHDEKMRKVIHEEEEIVVATQPLVEEHDVLHTEIPHVENRIEALVTNLSTSSAPWDKFKADVLEKM